MTGYPRISVWALIRDFGRWRKFSAEELLGRDQVNLDVSWITEAQTDEEMMSLDEVLAQMEERVKTIQGAFAILRKELGNEI